MSALEKAIEVLQPLENNPASSPILTIGDSSYNSVSISWAITDDGMCPVEKYNIVLVCIGSEQVLTHEVDGNESTLLITSVLFPSFVFENSYVIYMIGVNCYGNTNISNGLSIGPILPDIPSIQSSNFGLNGTLNLIIDPKDPFPDNGQITFTLRISNPIEVLETTVSTLTPSISGLSDGLTYDISVKACSSIGCSLFSEPVQVSVPFLPEASDDYEPLGVPVLYAKAYDAKIIATWTDIDEFLSYVLKLKDLATNNVFIYSNEGGNSLFTFTSLVNNANYEISIMSYNSNCRSEYCTPIVLTPRVTPDPVTSEENIYCGDGVIHVFFTHPNAVEGHNYLYVYKAIDSETDYVVSSEPISELDYKFLGLNQQHQYTITIEAFDAATNDSSNIVIAGENILATSIGCLLKGTCVLSAKKEWVAIENVHRGDFLWSPSFGAEVKVSRVIVQELPNHKKTLPLCIRKGDIRFKNLRGDVYISPAHAVLINDKFYEAWSIPSIEVIETKSKMITYYNIELEGCKDPFKYTLCAEGLTVESLGERCSIGRDGITYSNSFESRNSCSV